MLKSDLRLTVLLTLAPIGVIADVSPELVLALIMGLSLRLAHNWAKNTIGLKDSTIRLICALGVAYFILNLKNFYFVTHNPVISIFFSSMISLEIVSESIKITQLGFRTWFSNIVKNLAGTKHE